MARRRTRKSGSCASALWLTLAFFFLSATGGVFCWGVWVFLNPDSALNPFPPPTLPPTVTPLPEVTPVLPGSPVPTSTHTLTPSPTATGTPTRMPTRTATPTGTPTLTPTTTSSLTPVRYAYRVQPGTPTYLPAQTLFPDRGCNWLGVTGQILDAQGRPVPEPFFLLVQGKVNGQIVRLIGYAGTAPQLGEVEGQVSGFDIKIADQPFASTGVFTLQLFDLNTGKPLSEPVPFDTFADCERNAILINFIP